jgi:hypothetical protein
VDPLQRSVSGGAGMAGKTTRQKATWRIDLDMLIQFGHFINSIGTEKMFQYADVPEVGKYYKTRAGVIVQVEDLRSNGYWLGRYAVHPNGDRADHRQWNPWWSKGFFEEINPVPNQGLLCDCDGCKTKKIAALVPLGA